MPRLPTVENMGRAATPSVGGRVQNLDLRTPQLGQEAQAEVTFGNAIKGVGDTLAVLADNEKQRMDAARAEDAFTQYQNHTLDLEYGPQNGFDKILGGDAVKQPLVQMYREKRASIASDIRDGLSNSDQVTAFNKRAAIVDSQFDARLYRHVSDQSRAYQSQVSTGLIESERQAAAKNWDQPGQIEMSILRTNKEVERKAALDGTPPDMINALKQNAQTQIHANVMDQMIVTNKDAAAASYYNAVKDQLTPEARVILGMKVKAANTDGNAIRTTDTVWNAVGPKSPNDPVRLDVMLPWVRDTLKDDPQAMKAAEADLRSRAAAHNDGQREFTNANQASVLEEYHNGAPLSALQTMPEYQALDGESKIKLRDYIVDRGHTDQQHARADAQYREGAKSAAGFSTYWELNNPHVLGSMSQSAILSLEPVLGQQLTGDLMKAKEKLSDPTNVKAATIDAELFNTLASNAGLKPYDKNITPSDKENLGRLKNEVEANIAVAQSGGVALDRTQKEKLMQSVIDKKVMVSGWIKDSSMPAAVVKPEQRSKIYVPINDIDQTWLKGAVNYMRSAGLAPVDWPDEKIKQSMRQRLERGYAISISGGSSEEGRKALEGQ